MNKLNQKTIYFKWLLFLCLLNFSVDINAQCAGTSSTVTICDKYSDSNNQSYDLNNVLIGELPGGTWSTNDPAVYFALQENTGILNLWRIHYAGTHVFTYTNNLCGESATVTIDLGGYSGEDNIEGDANACSDDTAVDLNRFLGDQENDILPDVNGLWEEDPATFTGHLNDNFFNAEEAGPGNYTFTYTVAPVGSCPESISTIILKVHPRAESGEAQGLTICNNEDFSIYTNVNLNDLLTDEDSEGTWSDNSGTNQLSDLSDNIIDIQQIYNDFGIGEYSFTYLVYPTPYHPVCQESSTIVTITILPTLIGTLDVDNYCVSQDTFPVSLTYDDTYLYNGTYDITYSLSGVAQTETVSAILTNGVGSFNIEKSTAPTNSTVTLDITNIVGTSPSQTVCPSILVPSVDFLITNPSATTTNGCVNTDVTVDFMNIFDNTEVLSNQTHTIDYSITSPSGIITNLSENVLSFTNGTASFTIPGTNFVEGGDYDFNFDVVGGLDLGCTLSSSSSITPTPSEIQLDLVVDDNCDATLIDVLIDAPTLASGTYSITYDVVDQLSNNVLTQNSINFSGGTASYQIDVAGFAQGNYTVSVRSSQNDTTPCRLQFDFELQENFARGGVPDAPLADVLQTFCLSNYTSSGPTLEDISVTATGTILFYSTATDTSILPITTALVNGEDYFISNTDLNNNCEGSNRVQVVTMLTNPEGPTVTETNPEFCAADNATVSNLSVNVSNGDTTVWYDALTGGNLLDQTTILENGISYFASSENSNGCHSTDRVEVTPIVHELEPATLEFTTLSLCGLDNPTVTNLAVLENSNSYETRWFNDAESTTPLDSSTPLVANTMYYAESYNPITGCINPERFAVTILLSNCEPDAYNFFIPDAFSPNGDGKNDLYFIPNIEIIFPDFTLEILNRYGSSMFKGDINNPAWDGTNNKSSVAPNGVYFYIINYNKEGYNPIQGDLYLNR